VIITTELLIKNFGNAGIKFSLGAAGNAVATYPRIGGRSCYQEQLIIPLAEQAISSAEKNSSRL